MASVGSKECITSEEEKQNLVSNEGPEAFQKMLYNLFEKNGILNDLRAYLRSHIVDVLKSAQTGGLPACQKHFTQRLEFTSQALNILLAEYFLRYEFSYSLSVFISEIPLANMVFGFAKTLLQNDKENSELWFEDSDVWTILNYLGIQCDSVHAANVLEMYKNEKQSPLLLCILKSMPMYQMHNLGIDHAISSEESLLTPRGSADTLKNISSTVKHSDVCKHYSMCKPCQNKMGKVKEKYKKKKKALAKNNKQCEVNPHAVEDVMKNITVMERNIMDEMFEHLKSVYETEVEMVKVEEENKVKRSMVSHQQELQKKCDELEESFKVREAELERNVQQKKQFLWGLAQALREQHESLTKAMRDVKLETGRLTAKEHSLKSQLAEAETILKQRSEEMRLQISEELAILAGHLDSMKNERDTLMRERSELENLKASKTNSNDDLVRSQYDIVQNELALLRKYVETSQVTPKCVIERGTNTEWNDNVNLLNNTQERNSKLDDFESRLKANQLVNDFRKKNVNFNQSNMDDIFAEQRERSRSSGSSEAGDTFSPEIQFDRERTLHLIRRLRHENQRLRRQQRDYAERLDLASTSQPPTGPPHPVVTRPVPTTLSAGAINSGWCKGAGEELSVFVDAQPRILVPGDTLPFVGVLRDRHPARRQLISQWRSTRARWPIAGVSKRSISPLRDRIVCKPLASKNSLRSQGQMSFTEEQPNTSSLCREKQRQRKTLEINKNREKSPKSVLREAKQKLRNKSIIKCSPAPHRDKSPNTVLRDAKMRLRKLEIEAEAVEESYRNFRQRQNERSLKTDDTLRDKDIVETIDTRSLSPHTINRNLIHVKSQTIVKTPPIDIPNMMTSITRNYDNFLLAYNKFNIEQTYFSKELNKQADEHHLQNVKQENFLEKPLIEFRKLYRSERQFRYEDNHGPQDTESSNRIDKVDPHNSPSEGSLRKDALKNVKHDRDAEFEILKQNINKMYNIPNKNDAPEYGSNDEPVKDTENIVENSNMLQIEVESASEIHDIISPSKLLVVVSSVEARHITISSSNGSSEASKLRKKDNTSPRCIEEVTEPNSPEKHRRSESPEKAANLTRNDVLDAIFNAESAPHTSSVILQPSIEAVDSTSECEKDYADDFSADVDNYNSRSDYNNSPISQAKTSEDDNFWESSVI